MYQIRTFSSLPLIKRLVWKNHLNLNCKSLSTGVGVGIGDQIMEEFHTFFKAGKPPEKFNFSKHVFDRHAAHRGSATALWFDGDLPYQRDRKWTFNQLKDESIRSSIFLRNLLNLDEENPYILTILGRIPEWWFLHLAAIRVGTIFSPGTAMLTTQDIEYRLSASRAKMIVTDEQNLNKVDEACKNFPQVKKVVIMSPDTKNGQVKKDWINFNKLKDGISTNEIQGFENKDTDSNAIAQAYFTSGTTGMPKLVAHTHSSYGMGHWTTTKVLDLKETDLHWNLSDPGWAKSSYSNFFAPWIIGSTVFIHQMDKFEPQKVLRVLIEKPITTFCAPPTLYKALIQERDSSLFNFKSLRFCMGAGEPVNPEVAKVWEQKTKVKLNEGYGQTEMSAVDFTLTNKDGSVGIPNGFMDIRIVDEGGRECTVGVEGQVALKVKPIRPIGLFQGYLRKGPNGPEFDTEKNSSVFVGDFYLTGDQGYKDESGHVFLTGRGDDIISSSGYRIGPTEIESVLQMHPGVVESAAVASPDPKRGEVVKAFIVLIPEYKGREDKETLIKEMQAHVKLHTAPYKYPRKIEFVDTLPKTVSGKILRRELKRMEYEKYKKG